MALVTTSGRVLSREVGLRRPIAKASTPERFSVHGLCHLNGHYEDKRWETPASLRSVGESE